MLQVEELDRARMLERFVRAGVRLHEALEAGLRESGSPLTPQGVELIRVLCDYGPLSRARAARLLGVQPQSLGRLVAGLVALGAIGRDVKAGRKEVRLLVLREGERLLLGALEVMEQQESRFFRGVGAAERKLVLSIISYGAESVEWEAQRAWCPVLWHGERWK